MMIICSPTLFTRLSTRLHTCTYLCTTPSIARDNLLVRLMVDGYIHAWILLRVAHLSLFSIGNWNGTALIWTSMACSSSYHPAIHSYPLVEGLSSYFLSYLLLLVFTISAQNTSLASHLPRSPLTPSQARNTTSLSMLSAISRWSGSKWARPCLPCEDKAIPRCES